MSARAVVSALLLFALAGCQSFDPVPIADVPFQERAEAQTEDDVTVNAVVLSADESKAVFDARLYDSGIQPIWLEITNESAQNVWYLPTGTDPEYFAPLEVAYLFRSGRSKSDMRAMNRYYYDRAMGKYVGSGETQSGFVFTHMELGTKSFNVDIFGEDEALRRFTFFCQVPGFRVDHEDVDWANIYPKSEMTDYDEAGLRRALESLPSHATKSDGTGAGNPLNLVLIGSPRDLYYAFIACGWDETGSLDDTENASISASRLRRYAPAPPMYVFGRRQDVALRKGRRNVRERNELRLWVTPYTLNGQAVWIGQIRRTIGAGLDNMLTYKIDADMDEARSYVIMSLWYAHTVSRFAYVAGVGAGSIEAPAGGRKEADYFTAAYFTDGLRAVLWIADEPVSFEEIEFVEWEDLPALTDPDA